DEFTVTRDAAKVVKDSATRVVNPWHERSSSQSPKGVGLVIRLSKSPRTYLLHDVEFFKTPSWTEGKAPARIVTSKDKGYASWKKQVPSLRFDAIELGTEAGIDILLYWDGR